jgi:hypothetical protein
MVTLYVKRWYILSCVVNIKKKSIIKYQSIVLN